MEPLEETPWDVIIAGTGLQESLLALALSRAEKKILHVDNKTYYGGAETALTLQDAEGWVKRVGIDSVNPASSFHSASIHRPQIKTDEASLEAAPLQPQLSFPRAYSLALAPQIIYARSSILSSLVSSHVDQQLDFLAVGTWFVYSSAEGNGHPKLTSIPNGREDILEDDSLDTRAKRNLMKFLKFVLTYEEQDEIWEEHAQTPFHQFLVTKFDMSDSILRPVQALILSTLPRDQITVEFALPRIARHLRSTGLFGAGFGAVVPKWGGFSEIAQVGCRASAVGGGIYVLGNGVKAVVTPAASHVHKEEEHSTIDVELLQGEKVKTRFLVSSQDNLPSNSTLPHDIAAGDTSTHTVARAIHIISSSLESLFPAVAEGGPIPAVAIIALPTAAFEAEVTTAYKSSNSDFVYIMVHSSDTGECPNGQSVLYSSVGADSATGKVLIEQAVAAFLCSVVKRADPSVGMAFLDRALDSLVLSTKEADAHVLWSMHYSQSSPREETERVPQRDDGAFVFPASSVDLALDDSVMERVKHVWESVLGDEADGDFMVFPARDGMQAEHEEVDL